MCLQNRSFQSSCHARNLMICSDVGTHDLFQYVQFYQLYSITITITLALVVIEFSELPLMFIHDS